jgi:nitroreductase
MDAYRAIVTKRDTRQYKPAPLKEETLRRILQAGRMAGSSKNGQPVRFVAVQTPAQKEALAKCGDFTTPIRDCAVAIVIILAPEGRVFDAGRSGQNIMVAGWAEGVASCPVAIHRPADVQQALGLPDGYTVEMVIAMGYPTDDAVFNRGNRRVDFEEMVHRERW